MMSDEETVVVDGASDVSESYIVSWLSIHGKYLIDLGFHANNSELPSGAKPRFKNRHARTCSARVYGFNASIDII